MRVTQGTFSYLPEFTDDEVKAQLQYALDNGWSLAIEFTDDPHPRNVYWDMWALPYFDVEDTSEVMEEINRAKEAFPNHYIRVTCFDPRYHRQTMGLQFMVHRPADEPGFRLERTETHDRVMNYTLHPYAADKPHRRRYQDGG